MRVTIGLVTQNRSEFCNWFVWNIAKQLRAAQIQKGDAEVIIVDSSRDPEQFQRELQAAVLAEDGAELAEWIVITLPFRAPLGKKRQLVLDHARGAYLFWTDDDDWYPEDRMLRHLPVLQHGAVWTAANTPLWYLLDTDLCWENGHAAEFPYAGTGGFDMRYARMVGFSLDARIGEDAIWMKNLMMHTGAPTYVPTNYRPLIVLVHGKNTCQALDDYKFEIELTGDTFEPSIHGVSQNEWKITKEKLAPLRCGPSPLCQPGWTTTTLGHH